MRPMRAGWMHILICLFLGSFFNRTVLMVGGAVMLMATRQQQRAFDVRAQLFWQRQHPHHAHGGWGLLWLRCC